MVHPRLRGKLSEYGFRSCTSVRFIPAYAGNSARFCAPVALDSVHPRLRGKLFLQKKTRYLAGGSSPLTRETPGKLRSTDAQTRFIPAYAGNSSNRLKDVLGLEVHPRLRGKLLETEALSRADIGSSPLTRETHLKWLQHYTNRLTAKLLKNISKQE